MQIAYSIKSDNATGLCRLLWRQSSSKNGIKVTCSTGTQPTDMVNTSNKGFSKGDGWQKGLKKAFVLAAAGWLRDEA